MRTPIALPPSFNGKERAMLIRRRFKQTVSLKGRLAAFAKKMREKANKMPSGRERDELLQKAGQADTAANIDEWANSPGLQPPK
jgi:hypothetical protein